MLRSLFLELKEAAGKADKGPLAFGKIGKVRFDLSEGTDLLAKENLEMKLKTDVGSGKWQEHCDQWWVIKCSATSANVKASRNE